MVNIAGLLCGITIRIAIFRGSRKSGVNIALQIRGREENTKCGHGSNTFCAAVRMPWSKKEKKRRTKTKLHCIIGKTYGVHKDTSFAHHARLEMILAPACSRRTRRWAGARGRRHRRYNPTDLGSGPLVPVVAGLAAGQLLRLSVKDVPPGWGGRSCRGGGGPVACDPQGDPGHRGALVQDLVLDLAREVEK